LTLTAAEVVRKAIRRSYARLIENETAVFGGNDPEAVHQARVATRRLRSDLKTFERFLEHEWTVGLRGELRWLGADLGAVRDTDVLRDRLYAHAAQLPPGDAETARHVLRRLDADRDSALASLTVSLRQPRYAELTAALAVAASQPRLLIAACTRADHALAPVVKKRWRKLDRAVRKLGRHPADGALHAVRIKAKRCRYAAEAAEPAFRKPARRFASAMAQVQEVLGEQHDAVTAIAWLSKTAQECSATEAYVLGRISEIEHAAARDARAEFFDVWQDARKKRLRAWL
jgi:CHAD domain-containing protein